VADLEREPAATATTAAAIAAATPNAAPIPIVDDHRQRECHHDSQSSGLAAGRGPRGEWGGELR
jgi:hypothetical protein